MFNIYDWVQAEWAVWEDDIVQQDRRTEWNRYSLQKIIVVHLNVTQVQHCWTCTESDDVLIWIKGSLN